MKGGAWRRLAGLIVFVMIFTASCNAIGINGADAAVAPSAQAQP